MAPSPKELSIHWVTLTQDADTEYISHVAVRLVLPANSQELFLHVLHS